jgi:hypothetical protein
MYYLKIFLLNQENPKYATKNLRHYWLRLLQHQLKILEIHLVYSKTKSELLFQKIKELKLKLPLFYN